MPSIIGRANTADGLVPASASEVFEGVEGIERRTYPGFTMNFITSPRVRRSSTP